MFLQRALVTLILGPLALFLVYQGGLAYFLPVAALLAAATIEYINLISDKRIIKTCKKLVSKGLSAINHHFNVYGSNLKQI